MTGDNFFFFSLYRGLSGEDISQKRGHFTNTDKQHKIEVKKAKYLLKITEKAEILAHGYREKKEDFNY